MNKYQNQAIRVFTLAVALGYGCLAFSTGATGKQYRLDNNPWPESATRPWVSGLPQLSESHSPRDESWANSIALCAVMKDENVTDVTEWITYYKWLGVDHIFLTDNNSSDGGAAMEQLEAAFPSSFLSLHSEMEPRGQLKVYAWCAEEHRASFNWMLFLDIDEFLVLRGRDAKKLGLKKFLNKYKLYGGLSVHWIIVGPSGRELRPETGGVLPYYKMCHKKVHPAVKTITNTYFLSGVTVHPHNMQFRGNVWPVNENRQVVETAWHATPQYRDKGFGNAHCKKTKDLKNCFLAPAVRHRPAVAEKIAIYHYITKSRQDFIAKLIRGSGVPGFSRDEKWFLGIEESETEDPMCEDAAQLADKCCAFLYDNASDANVKRRALGDASMAEMWNLVRHS